MLATILGHQAIEAGYRGDSQPPPTSSPARAARARTAAGRTPVRFWNGPQLLITDEHTVSCRLPGDAATSVRGHQPLLRTGSIATTNRGIADWGSITDDTTVAAAIRDRRLHHASVLAINGDSYRMMAHRNASTPSDGTFSTRSSGRSRFPRRISEFPRSGLGRLGDSRRRKGPRPWALSPSCTTSSSLRDWLPRTSPRRRVTISPISHLDSRYDVTDARAVR